MSGKRSTLSLLSETAAQHDHHQRHHQDEDRVLERQPGEPHGGRFPVQCAEAAGRGVSRATRTTVPSDRPSAPAITTSSPARTPLVTSSHSPAS